MTCGVVFRDVTFADDAETKMGRGLSATMKYEEDLQKFNSQRDELVLPKHSYWFDFWMFLLFDLSLLFVVYFLVP